MSKIIVLNPSLRNKIAAGEIIERPASVVKELLENSIDALSSNIEIDIIRAGKRLIRVSDDGLGMDKEDALLAFERYATSKIYTEEDLFKIKTLGFRGEALASISAVSKVRLYTAPRVASENFTEPNYPGTYLEIVGGQLKEEKICSMVGTTIEIRDLFFNTPARRKFLKSDATENYHNIDIVTKEAIPHYWIAFTLVIDNRKVMHLPKASSLKERLLQIYGADFLEGLFEVSVQKEDLKMSVFLSRCYNFRNNKSNQYIFINNRFIRDKTITQAIYKSYGELIPNDKHPIFFIFLTINPQLVDFNVHPTKREVRFRDKSEIFNFIKENLETNIAKLTSQASFLRKTSDSFKTVDNTYLISQKQIQLSEGIAEEPQLYNLSDTETIPYCFYIGESFVVIPKTDGLSIIDYHAASERIVYEKLLNKKDLTSSRLLYPQNVRLDANEYKIITENLHILEDLGFEIQDFGYQTVSVKSIPTYFEGTDLEILIKDIALSLKNSTDLTNKTDSSEINSKKNAIAVKIACKTSLRGKKLLDGKMITHLLRELSTTEFPDRCPHGRPTRIDISIEELKKIFRK